MLASCTLKFFPTKFSITARLSVSAILNYAAMQTELLGITQLLQALTVLN